MRRFALLTLAICLLFAGTARANEGEEIALANLPQGVTEHLRVTFPDAELLCAWKVVEGGKECYVVRIRDKGEVIDLYASRDGHIFARREEGFSVSGVPTLLQGGLILLLLGAVSGAIARWLVQVGRDKQLSVVTEWSSAWVGAVLVLGLIASQLATVPRDKDWLVLGLMCAVWGAVSASFVEIVGLLVQSVRGYRGSCRRWILGFCVAGIAFLSLTIPVDMLRKQRENQHYRTMALRPPANPS